MWVHTKFKKEYIDQLKEYFDVESNRMEEIVTTGKNEFEKIEPKEFANNLPTQQGFCYKIKIHRDTFNHWCNQAKDPKYIWEDKEDKKLFSDTYRMCKENQEKIWLENSLKWLYNWQFAIFIWKNVFWYKDKIETDVKHSWEIKNTWSLIGALTSKRDKTVVND